ncbi:MAG: tRNA (adenosine(37)-N6)-threonylcarbamoyltransferase complex ATPase subunit type 1 TsaE [Lactobacillaceae bacterium]|jgi:tRNA threonylcarbamoyladenosine biosynthesis protein TsaE|nr:tRNA (adenosine(37)-N6)-threonylcarbamoyltransferase complex ATPase subunit type 1 TsaE [Lactobacillaceae bacterium]
MEFTHKYVCSAENKTVELGVALARIAKKGDIFLLDGTLGMGKTVFARAFIQELSDAEEIPSPTFTLLQCYPSRKSEIYHYDLYRLKNPVEIFELGIEEALYGGISLIEWPEKMENFRPKDAFNIKILPDVNDNSSRIVEISVVSKEKNDRLNAMEF